MESHSTLRPFKINVSNEELTILKKKLELSRFPKAVEGAGWEYGVPIDEVKRLQTYWLEKFNWRKIEKRINQYPQFLQSVQVKDHGELDIHFLHKRSSRDDAIPLIFLHGWPGNFWEVEKILDGLTGPTDTSHQAFHVVSASLPGFGFSSHPSKAGFGIPQMADAMNQLMLSIGYVEYVAQGGDIGSFVARRLAYHYPMHCKAIHLNFLIASPPSLIWNPILWLQDHVGWFSKSEWAGIERTKWYFQGNEMGYVRIQGTKPHTLAVGLGDSPIGLLAWIYEKLHSWVDGYDWSEDEILTFVMVHWLSGPEGGVRVYKEFQLSPEILTGGRLWSSVPVGLSTFPKEVFAVPGRWAKNVANIKWHKRHDIGGHFPAIEVPELLVDDIRQYFRKAVKGCVKV
ncbi:putative epoxide hydrolase [Neolecta irregularis DAH-3]|uniref:Putative epoxide hydrolase n=1 Tax=Neolecta irregularis (strain DAH-3) TaxID=1198029 RepID=A0A1U7LHY3_NEOID|nr:putative epoxide hydrolase [Neolecta irregularis DAH-3]|eukprot:OLL22238.1 putative epoxide hydrolase [Neolecta irregularis DAH-3]